TSPLAWRPVVGAAGLLGRGLPGLGVAQLGPAGAGLASAVSTLVQLALALAAVRAAWDRGSEQSRRPEPTIIRAVLRLGTPIGLTLLAEVGSFALVSVLMGNLGQRALA